MIVVTGWPGNRSDFVAGWLASLDPSRFSDLLWAVYPGWGKSTIQPIWLWNTVGDLWHSEPVCNEDLARTRRLIAQTIDLQWQADAPIVVTKSHVSSYFAHQLIPEEHADKFCFVDILVNDEQSSVTVAWEEFAKNLLFSYSRHNQNIAIARDMLRCYSDRVTGNDKQDLEYYYEIFCKKIRDPEELNIRKNFEKFNKSCTHGVPVLSLDYRDLMQPNGCDVLLDHFEIEHTQPRHIWNNMLPVVESQHRHWCLGRWWERP